MAKTLEKLFKNADVCIMAAAVSDYRIDSASLKKIKRTNGSLSIKLVPNPDILARLGEIKEKQILVGFALEDTLDIGRAQNKMQRKNCDLMILNTIGAALGKDTTDITMILKGRKPESTGPTDKKSAARIILERIAAIAGRTNV
jgi:phosphopantothenoylcysteine decarboxylase/phosphopantothenate--cysteine ligase